MTESGAAEQSRDDEQALRKRLLLRVGLAGAVMAGLVAGLVIFDALVVKPERPVVDKTAQVIAPATEGKPAADAGPIAAAEPEPALPDAVKPTAGAEAAAEPERSSAPEDTMPPTKPERSLTVPARPQMAMIRPSAPVMILPPLASKEIARNAAPTTARSAEIQAKVADTNAKAAALAAKAAAVAATPPPVTQALEAARRFLVQVGVFSSIANAEELRAKLELAGVPAQIEARVQVGPFATRQEAEQARDKLKQLGIEPGLVMAAHK
jgi:DedD protein